MGVISLKEKANLPILAVTAQKSGANMLNTDVNTYIGLIKQGLELNNIHVII